MEEKIKYQKGFIQIPILIGIIFIVILSAGAGIAAYRNKKINTPPEMLDQQDGLVIQEQKNQEKLSQQQVVETEQTKEDIEPEIKTEEHQQEQFIAQKENFQAEQKTDQAKLEAEEAKAEEEQMRQEALKKQQEEVYVYHDYYPIVLSLSDDRGNIIKISDHNGYSGPYTSVKTKTSLKIGDEICLKIEAKDPQDRQILYGWQLTYKEAPANVKWTVDNEFRHQITAEDLKGAGEMFRIAVYIKSEKEYLRSSDLFDDSIFLDYILLP
jgi:hypothetical protein